MIKVRVTKNIIRKNEVAFGFTRSQIIVAVAGLLIGAAELKLLSGLNTDLKMTIIFVTMAAIIFFGILQINGTSVIGMLLKMLKGVDKRPYDRKGVYSDEKTEKQK